MLAGSWAAAEAKGAQETAGCLRSEKLPHSPAPKEPRGEPQHRCGTPSSRLLASWTLSSCGSRELHKININIPF